MTSHRSSIHLMMFYMQSKEMFKLTPQLCRLARKEFEDTRNELPIDVRNDSSFDKILELIELVENSKYAKANETLNDAFREYDEMMSYFTPKKKVEPNETPSIFEEGWEPHTRKDSIPTSAVDNITVKEDNHTNYNNTNNTSKSPTGTTNYDKIDNNVKGVTSAGDEDQHIKLPPSMASLKPRDFSSTFNTSHVSHSPKTLAERFTALYKIEWRSAYDELESTLGDKQTVRHMLWIIAKSSIICASLATQQLADLENSVVGLMVSRDPLNKMSLVDESLAKKNEQTVLKARTMLVDYRRELAVISVPMLQKEIKRAIASELGTSLPRRFTGVGNNFIVYAEKCIEVIWLMYVHDPPMHLEWLTKEQEGTAYNTELYSTYTQSGSLFDYCVWPVVRLYKHGPVLCKGVAQGR